MILVCFRETQRAVTNPTLSNVADRRNSINLRLIQEGENLEKLLKNELVAGEGFEPSTFGL